jgi:hypothetical protein
VASRFCRQSAARCGLLMATGLLAVGMFAFAQDRSGARVRPSAPRDGGEKPVQEGPTTLREGTKLDNAAGSFRRTGDRITFYPIDSEQSFRALENLALERVARLLAETHTQRVWSVSGVITEFQGINYILLTQAVLKSKHFSTAESPQVGL